MLYIHYLLVILILKFLGIPKASKIERKGLGCWNNIVLACFKIPTLLRVISAMVVVANMWKLAGNLFYLCLLLRVPENFSLDGCRFNNINKYFYILWEFYCCCFYNLSQTMFTIYEYFLTFVDCEPIWGGANEVTDISAIPFWDGASFHSQRMNSKYHQVI